MKININKECVLISFKSIAFVAFFILLGIILLLGEIYFSWINHSIYQQVLQENLKKSPDVGTILLAGKSARLDNERIAFFWSNASFDVGIVRSNGQACVLTDIVIPTQFPENREYYEKALNSWSYYLLLYKYKNHVDETNTDYLRWKNAPSKMRDY